MEHRDIPEDGLHEPKGISTAVGNRVYISDGDGSGAWASLGTSSLRGAASAVTEPGMLLTTDGSGGLNAEVAPGSVRGEMVLTSNSTSVPLDAAADPTLADNTDYTVVDLPFSFEQVQGLTTGSNYIQTPQEGIYTIDLWATLTSSVADTDLSFKWVVNGTTFADRRARVHTGTAGNYASVSASGLHFLSSGGQLQVAVASSIAASITVEDFSMRVVLVEGS